MCFYLSITCPGNCGTTVANNDLIAACKLSTLQPRPYNWDQIHTSEYGTVPLLPSQVQSSLPQGYVCPEPTCSFHPDAATTTVDLSPVVRCPGCGIPHSKSNGVWVETWIGRSGILVPFLNQTQWSEFHCTQKNFCHFNPDYAQTILDTVKFAETEMLMQHASYDCSPSDDQVYYDDQDGPEGQNNQDHDGDYADQAALDDDPVIVHVQNVERAGQNGQASSKPKRKQTVPSGQRIIREPRKYQWILPKPAHTPGAA